MDETVSSFVKMKYYIESSYSMVDGPNDMIDDSWDIEQFYKSVVDDVKNNKTIYKVPYIDYEPVIKYISSRPVIETLLKIPPGFPTQKVSTLFGMYCDREKENMKKYINLYSDLFKEWKTHIINVVNIKANIARLAGDKYYEKKLKDFKKIVEKNI